MGRCGSMISSPPGQIVKRFLGEASFEIVLSLAIVEETVRAFGYPRVRKYIHASVDPALWLEDVILLAQFVAGDYEIGGVSEAQTMTSTLRRRSKAARR